MSARMSIRGLRGGEGALLAWAGENGFWRVEVTVRTGNARAARFYQRLGFHEAAEK